MKSREEFIKEVYADDAIDVVYYWELNTINIKIKGAALFLNQEPNKAPYENCGCSNFSQYGLIQYGDLDLKPSQVKLLITKLQIALDYFDYMNNGIMEANKGVGNV
jgi:hypothetical protein